MRDRRGGNADVGRVRPRQQNSGTVANGDSNHFRYSSHHPSVADRHDNCAESRRSCAYALRVNPILHLSLPVTDLAEARAFYVDGLGCREGRASATAADFWFFGMQLTLHQVPDQVPDDQGVRHFGATLDRADIEAIHARLTERGHRSIPPLITRHEGTPQQETKAYFTDPTGNIIELKAYADLDSTVLATSTTYA